MPILAKSPAGTVTGIWGAAYVRLPSGKLKALQLGDKVKPGEQIVTTQDGIVQITNPKGKVAEVKPVTPQDSEVDRAIAAIEQGDEDAATAAGLTGGADGGMQPGLRVDRVHEEVGQLAFRFDTARGGRGEEFGRGEKLFIAREVPPAQLSINDVEVNEAAGVAVYTITLSRPSATPVTVNFATQDGVAKAGSDYTATSGSLTFAPGETRKTITVAIANDSVFEGVEGYRVVLSGASGNVRVTDAIGQGGINDQGGPTTPPPRPNNPPTTPDDDRPTITINDVTVNEAAGVAIYTVTLSNPTSASVVTVNYATQDGTAKAGSDYTATNGTLTFQPGETTKTITVPITNDTVSEGAEGYSVVLSGASANAKIGDATAQGGIDDQGGPGTPPPGPNVPPEVPDDDTPTASINDVEVNEAAGKIIFTVTLSNPSDKAIS
ncbi:MAG TPA: Calx-beta domain-containing protein, partial [Aquabacterium sp.]|nr:Calx-beta domain-containing protein [Aquabacterium sp.]